MYAIGDAPRRYSQVHQTFSDEAKQYAVGSLGKARFDQHFVKKHNVIFERVKFNRRVQGEDETADSFIADLNCLEHCNYGALHDELIRDKTVVGPQGAEESNLR